MFVSSWPWYTTQISSISVVNVIRCQLLFSVKYQTMKCLTSFTWPLWLSYFSIFNWTLNYPKSPPPFTSVIWSLKSSLYNHHPFKLLCISMTTLMMKLFFISFNKLYAYFLSLFNDTCASNNLFLFSRIDTCSTCKYCLLNL